MYPKEKNRVVFKIKMKIQPILDLRNLRGLPVVII